jgi:O-antigen/teichoic acid export membrane protein
VKYKLKLKEMIPKWDELFSQDKKTDEKDVDVVKEVLGSFVKSTLLKMVIQNCEKVILSFVLDNTNEEKGEYSFVIDKFGLINGILLEPVEENFYNVINKIKNYDNNDKDKDKGNSERSLNILKLFVKAMLLFGTFLVGYMFLIGKEIFEIVFSSKWASLSTIKIAKIYSIYVAIISVNGIVESYASATNNTQQMNQTNILMISNSCMLMVLSFLLSKVDICGLIYANAISMVIRIFGNLYIIFWSKQSEKQERKWKGINTFINEYYLSYGSIIGTVSCLSFGWFVKEGVLSGKGNFVKICACGMIGVINLGLVVLFEKNRIKNEIQKIKRD